MAELVTGDDVDLTVQLYKDSATFSIDPSATVAARVISTDHKQVLFNTVQCHSTASGANWPASLLMVTFPSAYTSQTSHNGRAVLEIQVDDGDRETFFGDVYLVQGTI